jgi:hypothetical protein
MNESHGLSRTQLGGLLKVGDVLIPGDDELPSFSRSGCAPHATRMLPYMNDADRQGLTLLLTVFRFLPKLAIRAIMALTEYHRFFPGPLGAAFRLINIGVKGVVMSLYYSDVREGTSIHQVLGWDAKVVEREGSNRHSVALTQ